MLLEKNNQFFFKFFTFQKNRKAWPPGESHRPVKRLFTPEIKRMLKDWLVRRRENPYPSRDEKKTLAIECGLTYTQICNWFANWRRKLKNSGREPSKKTWGNLIKNYNTNAKGNVEQFSICSGDSIWGDEGEMSQFSTGSSSSTDHNYDHHMNERSQYYQLYLNSNNNNNNNINSSINYNVDDSKQFIDNQYREYLQKNQKLVHMQFNGSSLQVINNFTDNIKTEEFLDHCYTTTIKSLSPGSSSQAQCFQISSTTDDMKIEEAQNEFNKSFSNPKYKNHIMEKYLRGLNETKGDFKEPKKPQLSKWLESAAKFTPEKNSYIDWNLTKK